MTGDAGTGPETGAGATTGAAAHGPMRRSGGAPAAAAAYFGLVFTIAFALGSIRTLWLAPLLGSALGAVLCEVPLLLAVSWIAAGWMLRRWRVTGAGEAATIGALAFGMLMAAECALAVLAFGQSPDEWLAGLATAAGAAGLAGQMGFAVMPWVLVWRGALFAASREFLDL